MNIQKLLFIVCLSVSLNSCNECSSDIWPLDFEGIVLARYIDTNYKDIPTLRIKTFDDSFIIRSVPSDDTSGGLWSHVRAGDTIIKKKGELFFGLKRGDTLEKYMFGKCY